MITCKECKYWNCQSSYTYIEPYKLRECSCDKFKIGYHFKDEDLQDDEVLIEGDEGWGFMTAPNFGCIHGKGNI